MRAVRIIALLLTLCIFASMLLACNNTEDPTPSGTQAPTDAPTDKPTDSTEKPTTPVAKPTAKPTQPAYNDGDLEYWIEIVDYNGEEFDASSVDIGQGSYMYVVKDTSPEEYEEYKASLEDEGFFLYTTNEIGDNKFATYITETQIVHTMLIYYNYDKTDTNYKGFAAQPHYEVRVMEDSRSEFDLPGLESQNVYDVNSSVTESFTLLSDDEVTWPGRMGYLYQLADGSFFIIDGGYWSETNPKESSATTLMNVMTKYAPDPNNIVIAGWLFTHIHSDHVGAFYDISRNQSYMNKITVEKVIYNMPSSAEMLVQDKYDQYTGALKSEYGVSKWENIFNNSLKAIAPLEVVKAHPGQQFFLRDLTLTVYVAQDLLLYSTKTDGDRGDSLESIDWHNSTSVITSVEFKGKTTLYLGDSHKLAFVYLTTPVWREVMSEAEIVQVAHHGYSDTRADLLYKYLSPEIVLWPVYAYHYFVSDSYSGGVSGLSINSNLTKEGIKQVYHENDICITCTDFEAWEFYEWDAVKN